MWKIKLGIQKGGCQYLFPIEKHGQKLKVELGVVTFKLILKNYGPCVPSPIFLILNEFALIVHNLGKLT